MPPIDFNAVNPLRSADADDPEALFTAVQALPQWTERSLHWVDAIVTEWVGDALAVAANREGWAELHSLLERVQVIQPLATQTEALRPTVEAFYYRWDALADLLAARAHRHDRHDPAQIENRTHMPKLKDALRAAAPDPLPVRELPEVLALSPSRVSQLLSLAEAAGLVVRVRENGQRLVHAAGKWASDKQQSDAQTRANNDPPPHRRSPLSPRGAAYLAA